MRAQPPIASRLNCFAKVEINSLFKKHDRTNGHIAEPVFIGFFAWFSGKMPHSERRPIRLIKLPDYSLIRGNQAENLQFPCTTHSCSPVISHGAAWLASSADRIAHLRVFRANQ
jgi:hypothetical protein